MRERERGCQNIRLSSSVRPRPSLRVVCPASAVRAPRRQSPRRQMLKMRLMAENEGGKEGDFAPLIDASAKSEKCSPACTPACLPFPHSLFPSFSLSFLSIRSFNQASRDSPPPFSLSPSILWRLVLLPPLRNANVCFAPCLLYLPRLVLPSIVLVRNTACFRVCSLLASFSTEVHPNFVSN